MARVQDYRVSAMLAGLAAQLTDQVPEEYRPFVTAGILIAGYAFHLFAPEYHHGDDHRHTGQRQDTVAGA